ncbi:MAG: DUF1015 domain-containing protein [Brevinematales bacterium]|nr:DUF1015 domain-containing protein [Brevinematales bacterium]
MAKVLPFSGVYYNPDKFSRFEQLVSPTYDTITDSIKSKLKEEVNNFSYLISPDGNGEKYKNAVNKFFGWLLRDVLIIDKKPSFYIIEVQRKIEGVNYTHYGICGLLKIEDYSDKLKKNQVVSENQLNDRYMLIKETQTNPEPVCFIYKDKERELNSKIKDFLSNKKEKFQVEFMRNLYKIYEVDEETLSKNIKTFFNDVPLYLIDGHHRYDAALKYMKEKKEELGSKYSGKEPFNFVFSCFFNFYDEAIFINPVHRGVKNFGISITDILKTLSNDYKFALIQFNNPKEELIARKKVNFIIEENRKKGLLSFGFYHKSANNKYFILSYNKQLNADILDTDFFNKTIISKFNQPEISYFYDFETPFDVVKSGELEGVFLINGVNKEKIISLIEQNKTFEPQSFCFSPQIPGGLMLFSYRYSSIGLD